MEKEEKMGNVTLVSYADIIGAMRKQYYDCLNDASESEGYVVEEVLYW